MSCKHLFLRDEVIWFIWQILYGRLAVFTGMTQMRVEIKLMLRNKIGMKILKRALRLRLAMRPFTPTGLFLIVFKTSLFKGKV